MVSSGLHQIQERIKKYFSKMLFASALPEFAVQFGAVATVYSAGPARFQAGPESMLCGVLIKNDE